MRRTSRKTRRLTSWVKRVSRSCRSTAFRNVASNVKMPEAVARAAFTGSRPCSRGSSAPFQHSKSGSKPRLPSGLRQTSRPWPGGCKHAFLFRREATNSNSKYCWTWLYHGTHGLPSSNTMVYQTRVDPAMVLKVCPCLVPDEGRP